MYVIEHTYIHMDICVIMLLFRVHPNLTGNNSTYMVSQKPSL